MEMNQTLSGTFHLTQDIDCTGTTIIAIGSNTSPFTGILEGNGHKITNITIIGNTYNCAGLLAATSNAHIQNIIFEDFFVNTDSHSEVGLIAGVSRSTNIINITLTSSGGINKVLGGGQFFKINFQFFFFFQKTFFLFFKIKGETGGMVGFACSTTFQNCVVENTFVNVTNSDAGGFIGQGSTAVFIDCYQLGISSNPNGVILQSTSNGGGMAGDCCNCCFLRCGVEKGQINVASASAGGVVGILAQNSLNMTQIYVTSQVNVISKGDNVGGLVGVICNTATSVIINNCYSQAVVNGSHTNSGGLIGQIQKGLNVTISNGKITKKT